MLSGIKEIVVVVLVLMGLFLLPRILRSSGASASRAAGGASGSGGTRSGMLRLAVLLSLLWVALAAVLLNPFSGSPLPFLGAGVVPVALGWGIRWVVLGFK
jgi:preprotein translocase subunit SecG